MLNLTSDVMLTLVDAETGMRGFPITGKDEFLQPDDAALVRLDGLGRKSAEEASALIAVGKGTAQMEAIRQHVAEMEKAGFQGTVQDVRQGHPPYAEGDTPSHGQRHSHGL